jgi:hypothetical protein
MTVLNHSAVCVNGYFAHDSEAYDVNDHRQHNQRHSPRPVGTERKRIENEDIESGLGNSHREPRTTF